MFVNAIQALAIIINLLSNSIQDPLAGMSHPDFIRLQAQYKFSLALENGVCNDYMTEKLWRPLEAGSIPIVFGSPRVRVRSS